MSVRASVEGQRNGCEKRRKARAGAEEEEESTDEKHLWKGGVWTFRKNNTLKNQPERQKKVQEEKTQWPVDLFKYLL